MFRINSPMNYVLLRFCLEFVWDISGNIKAFLSMRDCQSILWLISYPRFDLPVSSPITANIGKFHRWVALQVAMTFCWTLRWTNFGHVQHTVKFGWWSIGKCVFAFKNSTVFKSSCHCSGECIYVYKNVVVFKAYAARFSCRCYRQFIFVIAIGMLFKAYTVD